jgi:hypothetical protein
MSWFYRFFKKSDDEQVVSLENAASFDIVTGNATITTGNFKVTAGNMDLIAGTARMAASKAFFFGPGSVGIISVATSVDPSVTGIAGMDINSICVGGTAGLYRKTAHAVTSWASVYTSASW